MITKPRPIPDMSGNIKQRLNLQSVIREFESMGVETPEKLTNKTYLKNQYRQFATKRAQDRFLIALCGPANRSFAKKFVESL